MEQAFPSPFLETNQSSDEELAGRVKSGDRDAAELLLRRHQSWIFNLSLRMLRLHADAQDATQEILLKVLKALPEFRGQSKVRTWLYRIAVNHLLNVRKSNWTASQAICSFSQAAAGLRRVPDFDAPDPRTVPVPVDLLIEETKNHCMIGTLLCLDGRQRLVFILGEVFGVSDEVGAQVVEVTPVNFRQILSRARHDLYEYLRGNCSLVNPDAHCKCARKTRAFMQSGFVDPQKLRFTRAHMRRIDEVADSRADEWTDAYMKTAGRVFRDHPFYEPAEQIAMLRRVLDSISFDAKTAKEE